ncbi:MAG: hypothetical protein JWL90_162 [Chthoniobacteraceae bacterium]|nr:hypothetical protein [Chthoniobacteraceae bacterium]
MRVGNKLHGQTARASNPLPAKSAGIRLFTVANPALALFVISPLSRPC